MSVRDLETWDYFFDEETGITYYLSGSRRIVIILDPQKHDSDGEGWLWRVYDNGFDLDDPYDVLYDECWDHELCYFDSPTSAYDDIIMKGYERSA